MSENYWKQNETTAFSVLYAYIDAEGHLADQIFMRKGLRIRKKAVLEKPGLPYHIIFCWVKKGGVEGFQTAMDELRNKLLIFGYRDYPDVCVDLAGILGS